MDFTRWLAGYAHADNALGDLARDVARDSTWPEDGDLTAYREHLEEVAGLNDESPAMKTLVEAWESYTLNCGPESGHIEPR